MTNFFDTLAPGDPNSLFPLREYIATHSPQQMVEEIRQSKFDANYLPDLGDLVRMFLKEQGRQYAKVLFGEGIRQLTQRPELLDPSTNLLFAKRNYCVCSMPDAPEDAFDVISTTPELIIADPSLVIFIAAGLVQNSRFDDAESLLCAIDRIPPGDLRQKLDDGEIGLDFVESLKARIRMRHARRFGDLDWLCNPEAGQPPDGLLDMDMGELTKHGIPREILSRIKAGVVLMASNDRKMSFCEFFDVNDPQPLLSRGIAGRFKADFHTRDGEHVNVYGVRYKDEEKE